MSGEKPRFYEILNQLIAGIAEERGSNPEELKRSFLERIRKKEVDTVGAVPTAASTTAQRTQRHSNE
jgi:hypothetical protein